MKLVDPKTITEKHNAIGLLLQSGCTQQTKEDLFGETKSGWWQDTVFLSVNPIHALQALKG